MIDQVVLSKENREGTCACCGDNVRGMAFVKRDDDYFYTCLECSNVGESRREAPVRYFMEVDEERMMREEIVSFLLMLAEEDDMIFKDPRLSVIKSFKDEIVDGSVTDKMDRYLRFNGNDISDVLKLRRFAVSAVRMSGEPYTEIVKLYISSRVRRLTDGQMNRINLLLSDKRVQCLDEDYKEVWKNIDTIREEADRETSTRRYDNIAEIRDVLTFLDEKGFLTENQLSRVQSFYFEMLRRAKKK